MKAYNKMTLPELFNAYENTKDKKELEAINKEIDNQTKDAIDITKAFTKELKELKELLY